jgi:crotonobetainyl-CoA:carnitine CoA-transferase CaiB-like acyl-CoA transferase
VVHRETLRPLLAERFLERTTAAWVDVLVAAGIPCGPIADVAAAFASPEARARGMLVEVEHPALGVLRQAGIPIELSTTPGSIRTAPPLLGEHTDEILRGVGLDADAIRALRDSAVI